MVKKIPDDETKKFRELIKIVRALRSEKGCPWDKKQSPQTIKSYLLEETYEAMEAIDREESDNVCEELGDIIFLVIFLSQLYQEDDHFAITDVLTNITDKMVRRHPHVFGNFVPESEQELRENWLAIKTSEKKKNNYQDKKEKTLLDEVPRSLPALKKAQRISELAAHSGFEWANVNQIFHKLAEEVSELKEALDSKKKQKVFEEFGDVLFVMANIGRKLGINCEDALNASTIKFTNRFHKMKNAISESGKSPTDLGEKQWLGYWKKIKNI